MIREILTHPNPKLYEKSLPIKVEDVSAGKYSKLISDMIETMNSKQGIGLAAPQIGELIRIVIINTKDGPLPLLNPEIIKKSWRKSTDEEGCLSVPETYGSVKRSHSIEVKAYSQFGKEIKFKASGLFARVIQHEIDHLDGVLFIDKVKRR